MEHLFSGGLVLRDDRCFPLGTDAILLADFARPPRGCAVCDLGCGCGAVGLLLCARDGALRLTGVEFDEAACETARDNAARSGMKDRVRILRADLREPGEMPPAGTFRAVVANPPYFPRGGTSAAGSRGRARSERTCAPDELCAAAARLLTNGGVFFLSYRPERLADMLCALRAHALEPKRIRLARCRTDAAPSVALLEARRGGGPGLRFEPDLILSGPDGAPTAEYRRIYHTEEA